MHPVAFFPRKLGLSEKNYDIGDRRLLAIKSALEEWQYLLEGAAHPILIFTDHKNIEYLRTAKLFRPRQVRWALFFSRFNFHITYRLGSKNIKPDAMSRMFPKTETPPSPDTILQARNFFFLPKLILCPRSIRHLWKSLYPHILVFRKERDFTGMGTKYSCPRIFIQSFYRLVTIIPWLVI